MRLVDTEDDVWMLFIRLAHDGSEIEGLRYRRPLVHLPDGTRIGIGPSSLCGYATIDITLLDGTEQRIHVR